MLPCVCSVIDHRGRQNVVRTSVTHSAAPRVPLFCSYHILTSSVIYYWTDARQHGIYLLSRRVELIQSSISALFIVEVKGENRSSRRQSSQSRGENQQTQLAYCVSTVEPRPHWWTARAQCCANTVPFDATALCFAGVHSRAGKARNTWTTSRENANIVWQHSANLRLA